MLEAAVMAGWMRTHRSLLSVPVEEALVPVAAVKAGSRRSLRSSVRAAEAWADSLLPGLVPLVLVVAASALIPPVVVILVAHW